MHQFKDNAIVFNQDINTKLVTVNNSTYIALDVSKVTDMRNMFNTAANIPLILDVQLYTNYLSNLIASI